MLKTILIILAIVVHGQRSADIKCDRKSENQMDADLGRVLVYGQTEVKFPETPEQLTPFCNRVRRTLERISKYTKSCLNKFGKDSAAVVIHTMFAELRSVCKPGKINRRATKLIEAGGCGNQGNSRFTKKCYIKFIDNMMGAVNAEVKMRIPIGCCNFHEFLRCWEIEAESVPKCNRNVRDFFHKWLNKMFEGLNQIICTVYDESNAQCDTIVKEGPPRNSTQKRYKSAIMALLNIAMSLQDEDDI